jgi:DNA-binding PadR family transcriptional regulator
MTMPTLQVLRALLDGGPSDRYGLRICEETGLPSGTVYPILSRLERAGWLDSEWEAVDPVSEGRPRRRIYTLSKAGAETARRKIAEAHLALGSRRSHRIGTPLAEGGRA